VQLPPSPPLPSPLPTGKESIGSAATGTLGPTPASSMLVATLAWAVATLAEGGPVSPEAAGVLAAALLVICLAAASLPRAAASPAGRTHPCGCRRAHTPAVALSSWDTPPFHTAAIP
jgi:hypothetical protein